MTEIEYRNYVSQIDKLQKILQSSSIQNDEILSIAETIKKQILRVEISEVINNQDSNLAVIGKINSMISEINDKISEIDDSKIEGSFLDTLYFLDEKQKRSVRRNALEEYLNDLEQIKENYINNIKKIKDNNMYYDISDPIKNRYIEETETSDTYIRVKPSDSDEFDIISDLLEYDNYKEILKRISDLEKESKKRKEPFISELDEIKEIRSEMLLLASVEKINDYLKKINEVHIPELEKDLEKQNETLFNLETCDTLHRKTVRKLNTTFFPRSQKLQDRFRIIEEEKKLIIRNVPNYKNYIVSENSKDFSIEDNPAYYHLNMLKSLIEQFTEEFPFTQFAMNINKIKPEIENYTMSYYNSNNKYILGFSYINNLEKIINEIKKEYSNLSRNDVLDYIRDYNSQYDKYLEDANEKEITINKELSKIDKETYDKYNEIIKEFPSEINDFATGNMGYLVKLYDNLENEKFRNLINRIIYEGYNLTPDNVRKLSEDGIVPTKTDEELKKLTSYKKLVEEEANKVNEQLDSFNTIEEVATKGISHKK